MGTDSSIVLLLTLILHNTLFIQYRISLYQDYLISLASCHTNYTRKIYSFVKTSALRFDKFTSVLGAGDGGQKESSLGGKH